jgi:hypothetical protein
MARAPRACNERGCPGLVYQQGRRRCEDHHVPWANHQRREETHSNTTARKLLKDRVFRRAGGRCQIGYPDICTGKATQLDRINCYGGYTDDNCEGLCEPCHRRKSSMEGHAASGHAVTVPTAAGKPAASLARPRVIQLGDGA